MRVVGTLKRPLTKRESAMNFDGFTTIDFAPRSGPGFLYVLCWVAEEGEVPFYVGETQSAWGRLNDYYWADFQASTDFKVGEAVSTYMQETVASLPSTKRAQTDCETKMRSLRPYVRKAERC